MLLDVVVSHRSITVQIVNLEVFSIVTSAKFVELLICSIMGPRLSFEFYRSGEGF